MKTIAKEWDDYWNMIKPSDPPKIQFEEMRTSFYAGAFSFLTLMLELYDETDEGGAIKLEAMKKEVESFLLQDAERRMGHAKETGKNNSQGKGTLH